MYRNLLGILVAFALALGVVALTFSRSADEPADFTFINGTEPKSLDPAIMTGQPEGRIAEAIFEGLTYHDPESLLPVPGVAKSWDVSADGRRYEFHLREDAVWSDGRPVTAHDFAWSWRRLQEPKVASEYAYILHMIEWAEIFNTYEGNAQVVLGPIKNAASALEALDALRREHPGGIPGAAWASFVGNHHLNEALKGAEDPAIVGGLTQQSEVTPEAAAAFREAMVEEAKRRRVLAKEADAKFGITEGVYARDDRTLVVELRAFTPYFLELTSFYPTFPVPRPVVEEHPDDWFLPGKIVSNGPFLLDQWKVNAKIRLVKNPRYWGRDAIRLGVVDALPTEDASTALNLYLTGAVDWLPSNYPTDLIPTLRQRPDFRQNTGYIVYFYRFNCSRPHLADPRVRQAICMAIDRNVITEHVTKLAQPPAYYLVPPGVQGYDQPETEIRYDPAAARRLLEEARRDGVRIPKMGVLHNTLEAHKKVAENIADQLRKNLGLEVTAYNQEWQSYQASVRNLDYDMARAGWIGDYLDPNTFLDMWVTNGGNNQTGWSNPFYDRLISFAADIEPFVRDPEPWLPNMKEPESARRHLEAVRAARGAAARVEATRLLRLHVLREAEAILVQDAFPILPVYFYIVSSLVGPHVRGFHSELRYPDGSTSPNLQDIHPIRGFWIEREAGGA